jgi:hypothetical protein
MPLPLGRPFGERRAPSARACVDEAIRSQVELVVFHAQAQLHLPERRSSQRRPFPYPVEMTPLGTGGKPDRSRSFVVVGKHLSDGGLDFYHREPLTEKKLVASFDIGRERRVELLLDLTWCRFSRHGWYEQGGRFVALTGQE